MNSQNSPVVGHNLHGQYTKANSVEDFKRNIANVQQRINRACLRVGRDPTGVRLLPVSKTFNEQDLRLAYAS